MALDLGAFQQGINQVLGTIQPPNILGPYQTMAALNQANIQQAAGIQGLQTGALEQQQKQLQLQQLQGLMNYLSNLHGQGKSITDPGIIDDLAQFGELGLNYGKSLASIRESEAKAGQATAEAGKAQRIEPTIPGVIDVTTGQIIPGSQRPPTEAEQTEMALKQSEIAEHYATTKKTISETSNWDLPTAQRSIQDLFPNPNDPNAVKFQGLAQIQANNPFELRKIVENATTQAAQVDQQRRQQAFDATLQGQRMDQETKLQGFRKMDKGDDTFLTKQASANTVLTLINLASGRQGNVVGYNYEPRSGMLDIQIAGRGSTRVPLGDVTEGGSDLDKIRGYFGKHLTGKSIDPEILAQARSVHEQLKANATSEWYATRSSISGRYSIPSQYLGSSPPAYVPSGGGARTPSFQDMQNAVNAAQSQ